MPDTCFYSLKYFLEIKEGRPPNCLFNKTVHYDIFSFVKYNLLKLRNTYLFGFWISAVTGG
ncbi:MAG: hypothetical protein A2Y94_08465 [Caldithrix sp. RBG_13_44_9]|nr:MAG: hypothetical protein A2Y94_08465 [Caldithrix sp. RBG_13_44_9]